jgi:glycosyltransferase involved in cell wall biosynthesis
MHAVIKVLVVIAELDVGGTERHLLSILPGVNGDGIEVKVFVFRPGGRLIPCMRNAGVDVIMAKRPPWAWFGTLLNAFSLYRTLWRERPEIVHFFLPEAYLIGGFCALLGPKCTKLMSRRSLNRYQQKRLSSRPLERFLHRFMDGVIANSHAVHRELVAEGMNEDRLGLIYNGVSAGPDGSDGMRADTRRELGVGDNEFLLVMVANLIAYKGHRDLLSALGIVEGRRQVDWRLLCIGRDTGIGDSLKEYATTLGIGSRIIWLGGLTPVANYLAASDIGILCSHEEGFSNAVLEAMAAGLPMIVSDAGGNPEAVEHGTSGLVVRTHDSEALARAILHLASDHDFRRKAGAAARTRVTERFALTTCIEAYRKVYLNAVGVDPKPLAAVISAGT